MRITVSTVVFLMLWTSSFAQRKLESSSDILHELKKLNVVGKALYVAAHPDDENTRLISWLENERLVETAYLSLTRGDGGQNLIGSEKGDAMGVLRTQELLEARNEDGAEQFFSRAVDFGYSKTADETLEIWDKEAVLGDVVYVIRKFKPDVIITRFPADGRGGHGHHTASSILAEEAFTLAADPAAYPDQLEEVEIWQAKRLLWDVYWWNTTLRDEAIASGGIIEVNIGEYNPLLGLSYSEIAADGRSQHKSQGFGSARSRGNKIEYLKHTKGDQAEQYLFEDINTTWTRVDGAESIEKSVQEIISNYKADQPSASVSGLVSLYQSMQEFENNYYVIQKMEDVKRLIKASAGIYVEALANNYNYVAGDKLTGKFSVVNRSDIPFKLKNISPKVDSSFDEINLAFNENVSFPFSIIFNKEISQPYWLQHTAYDKIIEADYDLRANPENKKVLMFEYTLNLNGVDINFEEPIDYKSTDRVDGELHRDVIISPKVTVNLADKVYLFSNDEAQQIDLLVEANQANINANLTVKVPEGWQVTPSSISLNFNAAGEQKAINISLTPPKNQSVGDLTIELNGKPAKSVQRIDYPHVKPQILFPDAKAKVVKVDLKKQVKSVGYIIGSGDDVAQNLKQVGFEVNSFNANELAVKDLSEFETIIVGIRAYNTEESMKNGNTILNEYVKNGGNVIVQYNTNRGLITDDIGPYPYHISRNRVTKEEAKPTFLKPNHPLLNQPNKIIQADFDGWVQERGLYFADEWDDNYEPILEWNDPGEEPQAGSILVADYGEGHFIFTGISFFRQLPAGVPGAYRLFTNMISYGK
ncbi:MAG: PIG-L family deacetylase [Vicingaceae bacterium]